MASVTATPTIVENSAIYGENAWRGLHDTDLEAFTIAEVEIQDPDLADVDPVTQWSSWRSGSTSDEGISGTTTWTNTGNIYAQDSSNASCVNPNTLSTYLQVQGFGFSAEIPVDAVINAIEVRVYRSKTGVDTIGLQDHQLMKGAFDSAGSLKGDSDAVTTYGTWFNTTGYYTFGGIGDTWGGYITGLMGVSVTASDFGFALQATRPSPTSGATALVDHIEMRINYTSTPTPAGTSNYLVLRGFGFALSVANVINGISLKIKPYEDGVGGFDEHIKDVAVYLWDGSAVVGTNKLNSVKYPTTPTERIYGSSTDGWGAPGLDYNDVNSANFGFAIAVKYANNTSVAAGPLIGRIPTGYVECEATIYYSDSASTSDTLVPAEVFQSNWPTVTDTLYPVEDFINKRWDEILVPIEEFNRYVATSVTFAEETLIGFEAFYGSTASLEEGAEILEPTETFFGMVPRFDEIITLVETFVISSPQHASLADVLEPIEDFTDQPQTAVTLAEYIELVEGFLTTGTDPHDPEMMSEILVPAETFTRGGSVYNRTIAETLVVDEGFLGWYMNRFQYTPGGSS